MTIDINNLLERTVEETGDLFYTTGDKSVRVAVWNHEDTRRAELHGDYLQVVTTRNETSSKMLKTFKFSDDEMARLSYLIRENDDKKSYGVV